MDTAYHAKMISVETISIPPLVKNVKVRVRMNSKTNIYRLRHPQNIISS